MRLEIDIDSEAFEDIIREYLLDLLPPIMQSADHNKGMALASSNDGGAGAEASSRYKRWYNENVEDYNAVVQVYNYLTPASDHIAKMTED